MSEVKTEIIEKNLSINRFKAVLLFSTGIFSIRYLTLLFSIIFSDRLLVFSTSILFILQIPLLIVGFSMFCYGIMGIKGLIPEKSLQKTLKTAVIVLTSMIILLAVVLITWFIMSLNPNPENTPYGYDLWAESIVIAMPFTELIPLTIAMNLIGGVFWKLRNTDGWKTNILITPIAFIPLTIIRIVSASLKIVNIIDPPRFQIAWEISDYARIVYSLLGIIAFIEIFIHIWKIKPRVINEQMKLK
ncbi:MAG TPA: hypothetical protein VMZ29_12400 [Candidatus Bathyarchaeia archaeon]|nr:hypothetical protein [Candidatus Bathyarchaeia archaeon]